LAVLAVSGPSPAAVWAAAAHVCSYLLAGTDAANGGADAPTEEALMVGTRKPRALYKPTQCAFLRRSRASTRERSRNRSFCLQVPADQVGATIGKEGARINLIRQASGCKVRGHSAHRAPNDTYARTTRALSRPSPPPPPFQSAAG